MGIQRISSSLSLAVARASRTLISSIRKCHRPFSWFIFRLYFTINEGSIKIRYFEYVVRVKNQCENVDTPHRSPMNE